MCVLGVCLDVAIDVANETHERENKRYDENARGDDSGGEATDKKSKDLGQSPQALHQQHSRKVLRFFGSLIWWRKVWVFIYFGDR